MDSYEKKYKEIVGKIRKAYLCAITDSTKAVLEEILPELIESKDEKIKKEIISFLEDIGLEELKKIPRDIGEWFAWLEKQGEQSQGKSAAESINEEKIDNANKVEPKFKIGDWVIYECGEDSAILQIKNIVYDTYEFTDDSTLNVADENTLRLWTIQDAKDGDVLATDDGNIFVFDGTVEDGKYPFAYYGLTRCRFESYDRRLPFTHDNVHPATKEQRDLLFAKMKEAGYEWNAEKKELKKVESKPAADFSDIRIWKYIVDAVLTKEYGIGNYLNNARTETIAKELQERFDKIGQKLIWSALDERNLQGIIDEIKANKNQAPQYDLETYDRFLSWLNSLKDRYTYKASNE